MRMHPGIALAAVLAMLATTMPATAQEHAQHAAAAAVPAPTPEGQRHAADASLRKGMGEIRAAVGALGHYEHGHMDSGQALAAVAIIERSIGDIVANCKLDPQADAALHGVLGTLGQGIAALKADPADMAAIAQLRKALQDYARLFDDAGVLPAA